MSLRLVKAAQAGQAWAWYRLVETHQGRVMALILRWGHRADAEDLFQEVFLRVHRNLGGFEGQSSLSTWIYRITMNLLHDRARTMKRHPERLAVDLERPDSGREEGFWERVPSEGVDLLEQMDAEKRRARVREAMLNLEPAEREILMLREWDDLSYDAIAEHLGLELGTVKSRLFRARAALGGLLMAGQGGEHA